MKMWMKYGIGIAAIVLAIAAGTAAFAMLGDDDDGSGTTTTNERQAEDPQTASEDGGGGLAQCAPGVTDCNDVATICLEGAEDCDDTIDSGGNAAGGTCLEGTTDCVDTPGVSVDCAQDAVDCGSDIVQAVYCEPGQTIEQCFPEGVPAGYDCVTLESFPVQVECFIGDDGDGDPCSPQPDANVRCLAPDCAVSSDGSIACPDDKPVCEDPAGCSAPGSCGAGGEGCQTEPGCAAAPEVCEREADEQAAEDAREDQPQPAPAQ